PAAPAWGVWLILCLVVPAWWVWTRRKRPPNGWTVRVGLICAACAYGSVRGWAAGPSILDTGVPVQAQAVVKSVHEYRGGLSVYLEVQHTNRGPCRAGAHWRIGRRASPAEAGVRAGDRLQLLGVFVDSDPAGATEGAAAGAVESGVWPGSGSAHLYEFRGRLLSVEHPSGGLFEELRAKVANGVRAAGPPGAAEQNLIQSIVFGGEGLDPGTKQDFLRAGLLHVLAASGANALVLATALERLLLPVARWLRLPAVCWMSLSVAALWLFAGMCGFTVSIVRATLMISYRSAAALCGRQVSTASAVWFSALVIACWQPAALRSISACLSYVATVAVSQAVQFERTFAARRGLRSGAGGRRAEARGDIRWPAVARLGWRGVQLLWRTVCATARASLLVELAVWPLTAVAFGQVTPYAVLSNLVAEPLLALMLPVSCAYLALAAAAPGVPLLTPLAALLGQGTMFLLRLLRVWVDTVAAWPGSLVSLHLSAGPWLGVYAFALWAFVHPARSSASGGTGSASGWTATLSDVGSVHFVKK
ncbi:MAG: ComEC/Rec2 family competence protein, partial [Alicyclobacillus sp.]|nr:ComEC/Rec2 family competence protein [Alicyclobacillus sp.]